MSHLLAVRGGGSHSWVGAAGSAGSHSWVGAAGSAGSGR